MEDAAHAEVDPDAATPLLVLASCPVPDRPRGATRLAGGMKIRITRGSLAYRIYRRQQINEAFNCNYELNPDFRGTLESAGLVVSGMGEHGEARVVELPAHPFFIATAFLPQMVSTEDRPHPVVTAFLKAAMAPRRES